MTLALTAPNVEDHAALLNFEQLATILGGGTPGWVETADTHGNAAFAPLPVNYVVVALSHVFGTVSNVSATFNHSLGVTPSAVLCIAGNSLFIGYEWTAANASTFTVSAFTTTNTNIAATITGSALVVR